MQVHEIYHSLQGEGIDIGLPTVFIRLTGCNLNCTWCDTEYAKEGGDELSSSEIISMLNSKHPSCRRICLTGGEPLHQLPASGDLMERLLSKGYDVIIETNGSIELEPIKDLLSKKNIIAAVDVKTPSSGELGSFKIENLELLDEHDMLKFVIADVADFEFARSFLEKHRPGCGIIFTAKDGTDLKWLAETVLEHKLDVRVLPQLHKIIWGADIKGK